MGKRLAILPPRGNVSTRRKIPSCPRWARLLSFLPVAGNTLAGESLRNLREWAGLTIDELATVASVSASYLSKVESGKREATPTWLGRVTRICVAHKATHGGIERAS